MFLTLSFPCNVLSVRDLSAEIGTIFARGGAAHLCNSFRAI